MACDSTTYDHGGVCPDPDCNMMLQWKGVPSLMWPEIDPKTGSIYFTVENNESGLNYLAMLEDEKISSAPSREELIIRFSPDGSKKLYFSNGSVMLNAEGRPMRGWR